MKRYLTIDGGTTNTRLVLVEDRVPIDRVKIPAGAGKTDKETMSVLLHDAIDAMLARHALHIGDITAILASGMITSEKGLCEITHTPAPAGAAELHQNMHTVDLPAAADIPITFISGVKMAGSTPETADIMRGEETEILGLSAQMSAATENTVCVLPGSHSKIIRLHNGQITDFSTMLTGELLAAVSGNTILRDAVDISLIETDAEWLCRGYTYARTRGINEALFKVRVLKNILGADDLARYSFFMGVILQGEIDRILEAHADCIIIGGRSAFRIPMTQLLERYTDASIIPVNDEQADFAAPLGMIMVYEYSE